jgi:hypothetical protein
MTHYDICLQCFEQYLRYIEFGADREIFEPDIKAAKRNNLCLRNECFRYADDDSMSVGEGNCEYKAEHAVLK